MILYTFIHKIISIILILLFPIFVFGQFNTVKPSAKPALSAFDSVRQNQKDTSAVGSGLDSLAWRLVFEQFQSDNNKTDTVKMPLRLYSPLCSIQITSPFGKRFHPIGKVWKLHNGVDLKAFYEPVYSIADGIVTTANYREKEGNYIVVSHGEVESVYCHLSVLLCKKGQFIKGGSCIGISGNSGNSTGPHLHFGIKKNIFLSDPIFYY